MEACNCKLVQAQLCSGTPGFAAAEGELVELLASHAELLDGVIRYGRIPIPATELMAEILPDLMCRWRNGQLQWFTRRYLKNAVRIWLRQADRRWERHLPLDEEGVGESASSVEYGEEEATLTRRRICRIYREFYRELDREERLLLRLARREGRMPGSDDSQHRTGWQLRVARALGRHPSWVTRHLDKLFARLARRLGLVHQTSRKCRRGEKAPMVAHP
jgi:hypothetical protein